MRDHMITFGRFSGMPGFKHEAQVRFFHNNPELAPELLHTLSGAAIPHYARAELGCTDLTSINTKSYKADDVTVLYDGGGRRLMAIIAEPQSKVDKEKPYTWPVYLADVRARLHCPVRLMVLCPDKATAEWARTPIFLGPPEMRLDPVVLGPDNTPVVTDPAQARRLPELATLSAAEHGEVPGVLEAAQAALDAVAERDRLIYTDYIAAKLNAAARTRWEDLMATGTYEWQSDFARKYIGQGREEGLAEGEARALLAVLEARGLTPSDAQRERITSCTDPDRLHAWIHKASTATTIDEVLD